jgi:aminoglycoside/choline kinase family phosphotransferase
MLPEKLAHALPKLAESAKVQAPYEVLPLPGDASARSYFRLKSANQTFIVMLLAEGFNSLAEQNTKTSKPIIELPYIDVGNYLARKNVRIPELHAYDAEHGALILEDFGDKLLQDVTNANLRPLYESALDQLERIAVIQKDQPDTSIAFSRKFDRDLYNWEFLHFVEYALDQRLKKPPSPSEREKIVGELSKITETYLTWPAFVTHRDYHSRNLMVLDDRNVGVIDFQDALLGPLFYDLASLLRDSYKSLDRKLQDDLVERYRNQMMPSVSREEFRHDFDLMGLHRNLKAAGRFCYFDTVKGNPKYLPFVPRTLGYVRETLERHDDLKSLRRLLLPYLDDVVKRCV